MVGAINRSVANLLPGKSGNPITIAQGATVQEPRRRLESFVEHSFQGERAAVCLHLRKISTKQVGKEPLATSQV
jgi:hypothetical protein